MEVINIEGVKIIRWSETSNKVVDDISFNDIHEITIMENKISYEVFNMKGEKIKQMKGFETFNNE